MTLEERVEAATMRAWPSAFSQDLDGWILRVDAGYTGRANSVTVLRQSPRFEPSAMDARIERCEARYAEAGFPSRFRLPALGIGQARLDDHLARRGYERISETRVQVCELGPAARLDEDGRDRGRAEPRSWGSGSGSDDGVEVRDAGLEDWMAGFRHLTGQELEAARHHAAILARIQPPQRRLQAWAGSELLGCGLGVRDGDLLGLFDFFVAGGTRRRGVGSALVRAALDWGRQGGAGQAYLQVVEENRAARALYARFGFRDRYRYGYRVQV